MTYYFLYFIVYIFGTVAGYVMIVGGSLPEMELFSRIVFESVLSRFWRDILPN